MPFTIALDQGTTSSRTLAFDSQFRIRYTAQREFPQYFPRPGWVEHDADEIWKTQSATLQKVIRQGSLTARSVRALGITNQRETVVAWDRETGKPLHRAIVWQCRRTVPDCERLQKNGMEGTLRKKTGLLIDAYFSATKMAWLYRQVPAVRSAARAGRLALGTIDSWLIYQLTRGQQFVTDFSNASRTQLMHLSTGDWDSELLALFGLKREWLPQIQDSDSCFGTIAYGALKGVPIHGVLGDQQASLFGHRCFRRHDMKNTYGTGCFMLQNRGSQRSKIPAGLLETAAWRIGGRSTFAFEGAVMVGGAVIQYLRDQLQIIRSAEETESLALSLDSNEGVYFVPAFVGLGTPHWDSSARGLLVGLTRGSSKAHIVRSALESIAYQSHDLLQAFGKAPQRLRVDGGASRNRFLMQFQSDLIGRPLAVHQMGEVTALGAALMAALGVGAVPDLTSLQNRTEKSEVYQPRWKPKERKQHLQKWDEAVARSRGWNSSG